MQGAIIEEQLPSVTRHSFKNGGLRYRSPTLQNAKWLNLSPRYFAQAPKYFESRY